MSYTIYYDKRVFKVGEDLYVAMISSGDNNCWQCSYPRDIPSKDWSPIRYKGKYILSKEEILLSIEGCDKWEVAKARNNYFKESEFRKWIMAGVKNAITIEDAVSYNKFNRFTLYDTKSYVHNYIETTDKLVEELNNITDNNIRVSLDCRNFTPKKRNKTNKEKEELTKFYVLKLSSNVSPTEKYFVRKSKWGYKYVFDKDSSYVRKFKTKKQATDYAQKLMDSIVNIYCQVEEVNTAC